MPTNYIKSGFSLSMNPTEYQAVELEENNYLAVEADDKAQLSYLGTPIFSDLLLKDPNGEFGLYVSTVLFDVSMSKNIIKTSIPGRKGTIKEYISDGDYVINIKGAFVNENSKQYPIDEVTEFIRLVKLPTALEVTSKLLQLYEIYNVVVDSYTLPQKAGFQNVQLFELNVISDIPIEFLANDQTIK